MHTLHDKNIPVTQCCFSVGSRQTQTAGHYQPAQGHGTAPTGNMSTGQDAFLFFLFAMPVYLHTCVHTYTHTYMHIHTHTYIHTYTRAYIHTYTPHTYLRTYIYTRAHLFWRTHTDMTHRTCMVDSCSLNWASSPLSLPFSACSRAGQSRGKDGCSHAHHGLPCPALPTYLRALQLHTASGQLSA